METPPKPVLPKLVPDTAAANSAGTVIAREEKKEWQGLHARLIRYLGNGAAESQAADATGCSTSYVSQMMADAEFKKAVDEARAKVSEARLEIDAIYEDVELAAARRLKTFSALVTDTDKLIRIGKFANEAKRKTPANLGTEDGAGVGAVVSLNLPNIIIAQIQLNPNNEVVQVNGQVLSTMMPDQLKQLMPRDLVLKDNLTQHDLNAEATHKAKRLKSPVDQYLDSL